MEISKDTLINHFGMTETVGDERISFPIKKVISLPRENHDEEDEGELAICVTQMRNKAELCLLLPDGALIFLYVKTIEELKAFEKCIASYEPNY